MLSLREPVVGDRLEYVFTKLVTFMCFSFSDVKPKLRYVNTFVSTGLDVVKL